MHFAIQSRAVGCIEIKCRSTARTNKEGKKEMAMAYKYIYALYYDYESEAQLPPLAYSTALLSSSEKERAQHQQRVAEKRARKNDCVAPFLLLLLRLLSPTHARIADECTANQKKEVLSTAASSSFFFVSTRGGKKSCAQLVEEEEEEEGLKKKITPEFERKARISLRARDTVKRKEKNTRSQIRTCAY